MTIKYLRKERALACPIHNAIKELAVKKLNTTGMFHKQHILDELRFNAIEDSVRWDYIREFIQEDHGCELVALAEAFFKRHQRVEERVNPEKFLASGHGKKTAGYAAVVAENDHLTIARIKQRKAMANGASIKFKEYLEAIERKRGTKMLSPSPQAYNERRESGFSWMTAC